MSLKRREQVRHKGNRGYFYRQPSKAEAKIRRYEKRATSRLRRLKLKRDGCSHVSFRGWFGD